ncbi:MAG: HAD family phosphatase [Peptococcaceae bacterium]|nr:MAG: HAD family phosphatase [Peptococcaceae bacterium]
MTIRVGFIWDIDGVVVDSPHEEAWRITALKAPWRVDELSTDFYFTHVASKPRYEGGNNILELKGVYERLGAETQQEKNLLLEKYCSEKNALIRDLIQAGKFKVFADAVTLLMEAKGRGILQAAASASKNAKDMLLKVSKHQLTEEATLYSIFDVDACGTDFKEKKDILGYAAGKLNELAKNELTRFVVFEDAPAGIRAAKSLGYFAVGILRIGEEEALRRAGADIVTTDLRTVKIEELL